MPFLVYVVGKLEFVDDVQRRGGLKNRPYNMSA